MQFDHIKGMWTYFKDNLYKYICLNEITSINKG